MHISSCRFAIVWLPASLFAFVCGCGGDSPRDLYREAMDQAQRGNIDSAIALADEISEDNGDWNDARLLVGRLEQSRGNTSAAINSFLAMKRDGSEVSLAATDTVLQLLFQDCRLEDAVEAMEYLMRLRPGDARTRSSLASILSAGGRRLRAEAHYMRLLQDGDIELSDLVALSVPERMSDDAQVLTRCAGAGEADRYAGYGLAIMEREAQQIDLARERIERVAETNRDSAEAQALLGEMLLDADPDAMAAWHEQLPASVRSSTAIWYVRGVWARQLGEDRVAARCFWEVVLQDAVHRRAYYQLGQVLRPFDEAASEMYTQRAQQLQEYSRLVESVLISKAQDQEQFLQLISLLMDMGREWEAWGWMSRGQQLAGRTMALPPEWNALSRIRTRNPPRVVKDKDVREKHDLSDYPDFDSIPAEKLARASESGAAASAGALQFVDRAAEQGLNFTYFQSPNLETGEVRIFESTGGGVGVIDLDLDGWPDAYLPQGEDWPPGQDAPVGSPDYQDQLFRNVAGRFQNVTVRGHVTDADRYGQGCSVGDFNNDGFPDVYVGNIGRNQLLLNNGDGTFSDATKRSGLNDSAWTTSCLILDLNADGNPDLYDVNYLQGENIFEIECGRNLCSVRNFQGARDAVHLSNGDGSFRTIPDATPAENAKGLGIVALYPDGDTRPQLFIANDQVPNHFLLPDSSDGRYRDEALALGLAVNRDGQPTACMGVAAGDLNRDRFVDLFVTNFDHEANCLYMQNEAGLFRDAISGSGLSGPGLPYVGWGTQFLDADNDGDLDLVVANGHVAEFEQPGVEYRMPIQLFRHSNTNSLTLELPETAGELFDRKLLGRSVALTDFNRDGRPDFLVTCLDTPVILATNQTTSAGKFVNVRLHARQGARDAAGSRVELKTHTNTHWQQLVAGDGYEACSERLLRFGIGEEQPTQLQIHWPSGQVSTFDNVPVDCTVDVTEGLPVLAVWPEDAATAGSLKVTEPSR